MKENTIYMDFNALLTLSTDLEMTQPDYSEQVALKELWCLYNEDKIKFVTSANDMKMDMILWLNNKGLYVNEMLRPFEAIKEYERWEMADRDIAKSLRKMFFYYDRIEKLPGIYDDTYKLSKELLEKLSYELYEQCTYDISKTKKILEECARSFGDFFSEKYWQDLSSMDYSLNWKVFESIMKRLNFEHDLALEENRRLFGLLNRVVGLSKKSSKYLPLTPSHIEFILEIVIKKYYRENIESIIKHIINCLYFNIEYMITTDKRLNERFKEKRDIIMEILNSKNKKFDILTPNEIKRKTAFLLQIT